MTPPATDNNSASGQTQLSLLTPRTSDWRSFVAHQDSEDEKKQAAKQTADELEQLLLSSLKMEHLIVLAGSGCSRSVDAPSMGDLWNAIVGQPPTDKAKEIAEKVHYDLKAPDKKNIELFLSHIVAYQLVHEDPKVEEFHTKAKTTILQKCSGFLENADLSTHQIFLHRLSRRRSRDRRLRLFTTNYDLCFERATSKIGGVAIDGFSFMAPRRYDPRFFDYDIIRRPRSSDDQGNYLEGVLLLHKLHGSVNWERNGDNVIETENPDPEHACLIYPASGKYQQSYSQPYLESISQYLASIREPNTCVLVVGFGFNDDHLSEPLLAAAQSNPHLRLIVVDPHLQAKCQNGSGNRFHTSLEGLSQKGEDVCLINAPFSDFAERIPDLKSLTPAERLYQAVQSAQKP